MDINQLVQQLQKFQAEFNLTTNRFYVGAGSALVLLGLRDSTNDADVAIDSIEALPSDGWSYDNKYNCWRFTSRVIRLTKLSLG